MDLSRRELLKLGVLGGGALLLPLQRSVFALDTNRMAESNLPKPFTTPFSVPPVARTVRTSATTDYYSMTMRESLADIIPGYKTRIWGYEGVFPGPTIDARQGREVVVRHINGLPAVHPALGYTPSTSVHLHGSASLPQYDGYASDVTPRGYYKDYHYPNFQDARTIWYHDHGVHQTSSNVYVGLAAMYRILDPVEQALPIPHGAYDVPLIVSDAMFTADGELLWNDNDESGVFGDVILVNGRPWPVMKVERRKYRFRILNASITRSYHWQLDSGEPMVVIGTDGGLMPQPQSVRDFRQANAERYEVIIDFAKYPVGKRVVLQNLSPKNNVNYNNTDKVMAFDVVGKARSKTGNSIPDSLRPGAEVMSLEPSMATVPTRVISMVRQNGQWTLNGQTWDDVISSGFQSTLATPALGDVEVWELRNDSGGWHHPLHIHLIDFKILDRDFDQSGVPVPPMRHELGPKDVAYVGENERVRVIARYGPHPGRYMIHCHNLVHEDHDMMGQFWVGGQGAASANPMTAAPAKSLPAPPL